MPSFFPLLASALLACSGGGADQPKEIVIGQYGSLTGTAATFGDRKSVV